MGLPNGFHDARLVELVINYSAGEIRMELELSVGGPRSENPEEYRAASLLMKGMYSCIVNPPDRGFRYGDEYRPVYIDGDDIEAGIPQDVRRLQQRLCPSVPVYWFYIITWSSYIFVACDGAELSWRNGSISAAPA